MSKKFFLSFQSPAITTQTLVFTHHAMTRNHERHWIRGARAADRGVEVYAIYDGFANLVVSPRFLRFRPPVRVLRFPVYTAGLRFFDLRRNRDVCGRRVRPGGIGGHLGFACSFGVVLRERGMANSERANHGQQHVHAIERAHGRTHETRVLLLAQASVRVYYLYL